MTFHSCVFLSHTYSSQKNNVSTLDSGRFEDRTVLFWAGSGLLEYRWPRLKPFSSLNPKVFYPLWSLLKVAELQNGFGPGFLKVKLGTGIR